MSTQEFEIYGGDSADAIAKTVAEDAAQSFCGSAEEFKAEYPGEQPVRHKFTLSVTKVD